MDGMPQWVIPMLATYYLNQLSLGLLFIAIALPPSIWIYWRFFKRKTDISKGRRNRFLMATAALSIWLANSVVPICYGDGRSWSIRLEAGYILFHSGHIVTHIGAANIHTFEYAWGLEFERQDSGFDVLMMAKNKAHFVMLALIPYIRHYPDVTHYPVLSGSNPGLAGQIPLWPLFGIPIAAFFVEEFRYRRFRRNGNCLGCGYDLRGSGSTCPECGRNF